MKMKNILLSSMLVFTLGLSGCNLFKKNSEEPASESSGQESSETPSSSEVEPVTLIRIEKLASIVVGQAVNLDDYVTVEGGEGPKVFTATVAAASADLAVVEGHTLTALAEGDINVTIAAGGLSAKFSTTAMSALKADFAEAIADISNTWAMLELDEGQLYFGAVHRPDYSCFAGWGDNNEAGGFLKAKNGNTYTYILNDDFDDITVDSKIYSGGFENYYCNFDFLLTAADFQTVEVDGAEALFMSGDVIGSWGEDFAPNKAAEFAYTLAVALNGNYMFNGLLITPFELQVSETETIDTFRFDLPIVAVADPESVLATYSYVMYLDEEETEVDVVRDYIDAGNVPEALAFDEIKTSFNAIATAKVYKYSLDGAWRNLTTGVKADCPEDLVSHGYDRYFMDEIEVSIVTANAKYTELGSGSKFGFVEKDGQLYRFANEQNQETSEWGTELIASALENKATLWGDLPEETLAAFADETVWNGFEVTDRKEDEVNNKVELSFSADVASAKVFEALMGPTEIGYYLNYILSEGWTSDMRSYFNCTVTINTTTNEVSFFGYMSWDGTIGYVLQASIEEIGTAELPDLSGIVYPEA